MYVHVYVWNVHAWDLELSTERLLLQTTHPRCSEVRHSRTLWSRAIKSLPQSPQKSEQDNPGDSEERGEVQPFSARTALDSLFPAGQERGDGAQVTRVPAILPPGQIADSLCPPPLSPAPSHSWQPPASTNPTCIVQIRKPRCRGTEWPPHSKLVSSGCRSDFKFMHSPSLDTQPPWV